MKQLNNYFTKALFGLTALLSADNLFAQEKVDINGHSVGSWFSTHWMWIAGVVVVLLLLLLISGGSSKRRSTIVERDEFGNVKTVKTTESID